MVRAPVNEDVGVFTANIVVTVRGLFGAARDHLVVAQCFAASCQAEFRSTLAAGSLEFLVAGSAAATYTSHFAWKS